MIEFGRSYLFEGQAFATMEKAQNEAVKAVIVKANHDLPLEDAKLFADLVIKCKAPLLAILTLTDASRPRARGAKKPRKTAPAAVTQPAPQQANLPAA